MQYKDASRVVVLFAITTIPETSRIMDAVVRLRRCYISIDPSHWRDDVVVLFKPVHHSTLYHSSSHPAQNSLPQFVSWLLLRVSQRLKIQLHSHNVDDFSKLEANPL